MYIWNLDEDCPAPCKLESSFVGSAHSNATLRFPFPGDFLRRPQVTGEVEPEAERLEDRDLDFCVGALCL